MGVFWTMWVVCVLKGFHCFLAAKVPGYQTFPKWSKLEFYKCPLCSKLFSFFFLSPSMPVPVSGSCEYRVMWHCCLVLRKSCALPYMLQLISVKTKRGTKPKRKIMTSWKYSYNFFLVGSKNNSLSWTGVRKTESKSHKYPSNVGWCVKWIKFLPPHLLAGTIEAEQKKKAFLESLGTCCCFSVAQFLDVWA